MKNKLLVILCVGVMLSFSGCESESESESTQTNIRTNETTTINSVGIDNLIEIGGYLYYDNVTKIVYFWNGAIGYHQNSTVPSPYLAPNGLPYKYEPETNFPS